MNGECRVRFSERTDDGLSEHSESRRTGNEKRLHDRRKRHGPGGLARDDCGFTDSGIKRLKDWVIGMIYDCGF